MGVLTNEEIDRIAKRTAAIMAEKPVSDERKFARKLFGRDENTGERVKKNNFIQELFAPQDDEKGGK
jgi:hypothetical protein